MADKIKNVVFSVLIKYPYEILDKNRFFLLFLRTHLVFLHSSSFDQEYYCILKKNVILWLLKCRIDHKPHLDFEDITLEQKTGPWCGVCVLGVITILLLLIERKSSHMHTHRERLLSRECNCVRETRRGIKSRYVELDKF